MSSIQEQALGALLTEFNLPARRTESLTRSNLSWLARNIAIGNQDHPRLVEAQALIKRLLFSANNAHIGRLVREKLENSE
jgi:hypothetical protein